MTHKNAVNQNEDTIKNKLEEIYQLLRQKEIHSHSLYTESGGKLLFLYEYAKYKNDPAIIADFESTLTHFAENFTQTPSTTFCSGVVGNMWLLEYFKKENIIDDLLSEINVDLNKNFAAWGNEFIKIKNYDFLHGLIGIIYGGNYCETISKSLIREQADAMLESLIASGGNHYMVDWMPDKEEDDPNIEKINLGLAHGIPAAMIALSNISELNIKYEKAAVSIGNFILENRRTEEKQSLYSTILYDKVQNENDSRLGWCYGDLGIALAFWQVGNKLKQENFKAEALRIMKHACNRTNLMENAVADCGLCHGSAGIAQIFRRFYWETKNIDFKNAADFWIQLTLEMATHKNGLAGYCVYRAIEDEKWITDYGMLEGIAGIGLALLGALQDEPSNWDQSLMISS
jgi:lantibiotic biosynthesis protein